MAVRCPQRALWGASTAWGPLPSAHGQTLTILPSPARHRGPPIPSLSSRPPLPVTKFSLTFLPPSCTRSWWARLGRAWGSRMQGRPQGCVCKSTWVLQGTWVGVSTARLSLAEATLMWTLGHRCMAPGSLTESAPPWMGTGHGMGALHILSRAGQVSGTSLKVAWAGGGCSGLGDAGTGPDSSRRVNELQEGERFVPRPQREMAYSAASSQLGGPSSPGRACSVHVEGSVLCGQEFTAARG